MGLKFIRQIMDAISGKHPPKNCKPTFVFDGKRTIDKTALIREGVIIQNPKGTEISIGANSQISPYVVMFGGNIKIDKNVMIGPHTTIVVGQHNWKQVAKPMIFGGTIKEEDIIIEEDVWIGANVTIVSGAHINKGAVVGANSFINSNVPPYAIVAGSPAKIIRYRYDENKSVEQNITV